MRIVLIGPPGAGKGTQARILSERLSVPAISTGDLFRAHLRADTQLGRRAKQYMDSGALVPDEVTAAMAADRLDREDAADGFLLDGFPRTEPQAELLQGMLEALDATLDAVLAYDVPDDHVVRRLTRRRTCDDCGLIQSAPPAGSPDACSACSGPLHQREDDREETIRRRLAVYAEQTAPLLRWYTDRGLLTRIDATAPVEEVTLQSLAALNARTPA